MRSPAPDAAVLDDAVLDDAVRRWAALRPDVLALVDIASHPEGAAIPRRALRLTWRELDGAVSEAADVLRARGVGPGDRVALQPGPSAAGVVALLGALRAGTVTILVHPRWTVTETEALLSSVRPRAIVRVGEDGHVDVAAGHLPDARLAAAAGPTPGALAAASRAAIGPDAAPELVVPTSGTTARPRLARLPVDRIAASVRAWRSVLPPATGWLLSLGMGHVSGIGIVARATAEGVPLAAPGGDQGIAEALARSSALGVTVSHVSLVPAQLERLLDERADGPPPPGVLAILLGGGPLPETLVRRAVGAGWPVIASYGSTETASGVAALPVGDAAARPWSSGRALAGAELRTDTAVTGERASAGGIAGSAGAAAGSVGQIPVPAAPPAASGRDRAGELLVRGPMVFAGYLDDPGATAARLSPDGWLRTGDLATLDGQGYLRIVERIDDVIIRGGENVSPAEVEAVLRSHPGVRDVAVVGVPDPAWGAAPVAVVVPRTGADPTDATLLAHAAERLARFRVPSRIVRAGTLPRGTGDKLLRRVLRAWVEAADAALPDLAAVQPRQPGVDPWEWRTVLADDGQALGLLATPADPARGEDARPQRMATPGRTVAPPPAVAPAPSVAPDVASLPPGSRPTVLLLHATLSGAAQLSRLARELTGDARVLLLDRRGSGRSRMARPVPVAVARHVADTVAALDASGAERAVVVGHSFGAVIALELAARHPERVAAVFAWEPPYVPLAPEPARSSLSAVADAVARAHGGEGPAAAARTFMAVVSPGAWDLLRPAQRAALEAQGDGVLADVAMPGLAADGLSAIRAPLVLATGGASEPFYAPIVSAVAGLIPGARMVSEPGLRHHAPITDPAAVARLVRPMLRPTVPHQEPSA